MTLTRTLCLAATLVAATAAQASANPLDTHWLKANAQANVAEIGAARWMLGQTDDTDVQALAKRLIKDHAKALAADKRVARAMNVTLELTPPADARWDLRELQQEVARGDVDKAYALLEVADHRVNIEATKEEISGGSTPAVVGLARQVLPVLQTHLAMARRTLAHVT